MAMYFDLQVNGYAGVDFNSLKTPESLSSVCHQLQEDQVQGILATIITDDVKRMTGNLQILCQAREFDPLVRQVVQGFHLEGPFLNPATGFVGAHPKSYVLEGDLDIMKRLIDAGQGLVRVVTLAPECDPGLRLTRWLADQGVVVSAGHCNPNLQTLDAAIDAGLSMATHLGNACPLQMHRHDNVIQRILSRASHLQIGFIADGVHVPYFALKNYLNIVDPDRCFIVTDAIAAAGCGPGQFQLGQQTVVVDSQGATWSADRQHLVGSASTMKQMAANLAGEGFSSATIEQLTWHNPRRALEFTM